MGETAVKRVSTLSIALFVLYGFARPTVTATLVVAGDGTAPYTSIQPAIDAAVPHQDEVFVRCGVYRENIVMRDGVSVSGERAQCTFIDPPETGEPAVTMTSLGAGTALRGFTIHNRANAAANGSGIEVTMGAPVITQNVIAGPGLLSNSGAGIFVNGGAPVISHNVIRGNDSCCYGGGIVLSYASALVQSNLIVGNASYYGAGIFIEGGDSRIVENTIVANAGWLGGGLNVGGVGTTVANNVVAFNSAVIYGGGVNDWGAGTVFEGNDVFGNQPDDYSQEDPTGTNGNISADPLFVDRYDEGFAGFEPRGSSPLVDAGSPGFGGERDIKGIPRPLDGDVDGVALPDIGARENEGVTGLKHTGGRLTWDPGSHQPPDYNVYRGDLATLEQTGAYTQDPAGVAGARHFCAVTNSIQDTDVPDPEQVFFYLAVAVGAVEGSLGFDAHRFERPRTRPCRSE